MAFTVLPGLPRLGPAVRRPRAAELAEITWTQTREPRGEGRRVPRGGRSRRAAITSEDPWSNVGSLYPSTPVLPSGDRSLRETLTTLCMQGALTRVARA